MGNYNTPGTWIGQVRKSNEERGNRHYFTEQLQNPSSSVHPAVQWKRTCQATVGGNQTLARSTLSEPFAAIGADRGKANYKNRQFLLFCFFVNIYTRKSPR